MTRHNVFVHLCMRTSYKTYIRCLSSQKILKWLFSPAWAKALFCHENYFRTLDRFRKMKIEYFITNQFLFSPLLHLIL